MAARSQGKTLIGAQAFIGTFGTNLFIAACTVAQAVLIARILGPMGRGEYAAVVLWPNTFAAVTIFGSNIAIARAAAREHNPEALSRSAIVLGLATAFLGSIACYLMIPWLMPRAAAHLIPIARAYVLFIPLNHLALNLVAIDQGSGDFRRYNLTRAILNPVYLTIASLLWLRGIASVQWFATALLVANMVVVVVRICVGFRHCYVWGRIYSPVRIVKESVRFGLAGIANPIYAQIDQALLLWLLGTENLGLYTVALSASSFVSSVTQASGAVTFTIAAQANPGEGYERIAKAFRISLLSWVILGGALAVVIPWVMPLVYGSDFAAAITPARLLIIGSACVGLSHQLEQAVRGQGKAFVGLEGRLAGLVVMAALAMILVPTSALKGACIAFVIGNLTCLLVVMYRVNKHYGLPMSVSNYLPNRSDIESLLVLTKNHLSTVWRTP